MYRPFVNDSLYELTPHMYDNYGDLISTWQYKEFNNSITLGLKHEYHYSAYGNGSYEVKFRSSAFTNDYDYNQSTFTWLNNQTIFKKLVLKTRVFAQYGAGSNTPTESALYLAGANPEEMADNPFTRAAGIIPSSWANYSYDLNYLQEGGGLNIRGYSGYTFVSSYNFRGKSYPVFTYYGNSGASVNGELEFNKLIHFNPRFLRNDFALTTYLFGDAGVINITPYPGQHVPLMFTNLIADAGIGAALTIQKWGPLQLVHPLTIRFDVPLLLNDPQNNAGPNYLEYRFVVGIGRAF
jgi:aminopeptidase N